MTNANSDPGLSDQGLSDQGLALILGGTGKTGRRVAELMRQAGHEVRIGSRSATPPFDWTERRTWESALSGVKAVYVAFQPDLAAVGALDIVRPFFATAAGMGVEKLVLLSGRGEPEAQDAERALQATNLDWTILRSSWFSQNFSESFLLEPIQAGEVVLPTGLAAEPFVDVDDIADIGFAALTTDRHSRQLYEITGPRAVTFAEAVAEIAAVTERHIAFIEVAPEDYRAELTRLDLPTEYVDLIMYLFTTVLDGRNIPLGDGIQRALGRDPSSFSDYVRRTAGVWGGNHA